MASFYIGDSALAVQVQTLTDRLNAEEAATAAASGRLDTVEAWKSDRVKYLYPNGGTEAAPATITANARYAMPSPFQAGRKFSTYLEWLQDGEWLSFEEVIYLNNAIGAKTSTRADVVFLVTGVNQISASSNSIGHPVIGASDVDFYAYSVRIKCVLED